MGDNIDKEPYNFYSLPDIVRMMGWSCSRNTKIDIMNCKNSLRKMVNPYANRRFPVQFRGRKSVVDRSVQ